VPISLGDAERVRGFRSYAVGSRVLFGTIEYRMPLLPSLETEVLGLAALGRTTLAAFADAGAVWRGADWDGGVQRIGVGAEVKNVLRLAGIPLTHALGTARPVGPSGTDRGWQLYYRVQTALPF
jgi:outer membrane protein assembly factor BamA